MEPPQKPSASLFQVYLRLRPRPNNNGNNGGAERCLLVEEPAATTTTTTEDSPADDHHHSEATATPTHITLNPPADRRRAIERFAFTRVFEEDATQLDLFQGTRVLPLVEGVLAPHGGDGTDGLLATLGVTGSGKTHTILGSRNQRGLTQLALDVLFRSINANIVDCARDPALESSIQLADASEANIYSAPSFLESVYSDFSGPSRAGSRAATPMIVGQPPPSFSFPRPPAAPPHTDAAPAPGVAAWPTVPGQFPESPTSVRLVSHADDFSRITLLSTPPGERGTNASVSRAWMWTPVVSAGQPKPAPASAIKRQQDQHYMALTSSAATKRHRKNKSIDAKTLPSFKAADFSSTQTPRRTLRERPSALPQMPDVGSLRASCDPSAEYAVVISMYEVYNDRIFDLLTPPIKSNATKEFRRRPLLFKPTELSPDRKVVAGLRKVVCGSLREALLVLEAGLHERRVAGTGSNSTSSRSHGFFCVEVKKRRSGRSNAAWGSSTFSVVDLAGSERARDAKTQGTTLAEAGKINESLMYLGQCLQMQSDMSSNTKPNLVPFRQCKLTELLFSNSFPSGNATQQPAQRRNPQRGVMIVTADPLGDFNATSQILRYSALAREVTVPRIPSITSTLLANGAPPAGGQGFSHHHLHQHHNHNQHDSGSSDILSSSPPASSPVMHHRRPPPASRNFSHQSDASDSRATMEHAAMEISHMAETIAQLHAELAQEAEARLQAEAHLMSMEDRLSDIEQEIREDCHADFEERLGLEMARWKASLNVELERGEEHWDRKVELLARGVGVTGDDGSAITPGGGDDNEEDKENVLIENLEQENERLRREVAVLKRELGSRTPSKRHPLQERGDVHSSGAGTANKATTAAGDVAGLGSKLEGLRVSNISNLSIDSDEGASGMQLRRSGRLKVNSSGSPTKKSSSRNKPAAKRWESLTADDGDDFV